MTTITDKLAEAIELAEDAMAYVPEYFANKHGMNRRMAALKEDFAAHASRQAEPSDAMVEAAAKALLARRELKLEHLTDKAREHYLEDVRAVLQAADAVSAGTPDGYVLVPEKATPLIREALRIGMRREVPNDDLCDIRWRAAIAAAQDSEKKESGS